MTTRTQELIDQLKLEPHVEGGYFRRTFCSDLSLETETTGDNRALLSSIFYLLTSDSPVGYFHQNRSDILHYFHEGDPLQYYLLWPDGGLEIPVMGRDLEQGQLLQLIVPGGVWKASRLINKVHGYGLISEAVAPGFDYRDMTLATAEDLCNRFPHHAEIIDRHCI